MRFLLFGLVINLVLALVNIRAYRRLVAAFPIGKRAKRAIVAVQAGSLLLATIGRLSSRTGYELPLQGAVVVALVIQLAVIISVVLLLVFDLMNLLSRVGTRVARVIHTGWRALRHHDMAGPRPALAPRALPEGSAGEPAGEPSEELGAVPSSGRPAAREEISRRAFGLQLAVGSAFVVGGASSTYGALVGRHDYVVEQVPIRIPGLKAGLDGFSIVQLSDLHIGQFVGEPELRAAESLVRDAKPDLIVLTGDLLDHDPRFSPLLGRFVRRLQPLAKQGVAVVSGNHDYYAGIEPTLGAARSAGARVLENAGFVIGDGSAGLAILGVNDVRAGQFEASGPDVQRALRSLPSVEGKLSRARDLPRVLLCHNPVYFEEAQAEVALQISGHTHGGQVNLLVRPADWLLRHGWVAGHYRVGDSQLYVNRGFGTVGPPARVGSPPEVTRFILTV